MKLFKVIRNDGCGDCAENLVFNAVLQKSIWYNKTMSKPEIIKRLNEINDKANAENRDLTEAEAEEADKLADAIYEGD